MSQHVRMYRKRQFCRLPGTLDHAQEPCRGYRCPLLSDENVGTSSTLKWSKGTQFGSPEWMDRFNSPRKPNTIPKIFAVQLRQKKRLEPIIISRIHSYPI